MIVQVLIAGFLLGTVSSFHCVGMCGPIALTLPVHYLPAHQKFAGILLYNAGRIFIYALLGLLFGFLGKQLYLGGMQKGFSVLLGSVLVIFFLRALMHRKNLRINWLDKTTHKLQQFIAVYMQQKKLYGFFILGAANGLLPCGMVYLAVTGALAAGSVAGGVWFMTAFGLGTFPAMFALSYFGSRLSLSARNTMKKAVPYVMLLMGVLLILRGLNLNIPYLSPYLQANMQEVVSCH